MWWIYIFSWWERRHWDNKTLKISKNSRSLTEHLTQINRECGIAQVLHCTCLVCTHGILVRRSSCLFHSLCKDNSHGPMYLLLLTWMFFIIINSCFILQRVQFNSCKLACQDLQVAVRSLRTVHHLTLWLLQRLLKLIFTADAMPAFQAFTLCDKGERKNKTDDQNFCIRHLLVMLIFWRLIWWLLRSRLM